MMLNTFICIEIHAKLFDKFLYNQKVSTLGLCIKVDLIIETTIDVLFLSLKNPVLPLQCNQEVFIRPIAFVYPSYSLMFLTYQTVRHNAYDDDPYAKEFGIKISERLATVEARTLPAPWVSYLYLDYC